MHLNSWIIFSKIVAADRPNSKHHNYTLCFPFKIAQKHSFQFSLGHLENMTYFRCLEIYSLFCNRIEVPFTVTWLRLNYHDECKSFLGSTRLTSGWNQNNFHETFDYCCLYIFAAKSSTRKGRFKIWHDSPLTCGNWEPLWFVVSRVSPASELTLPGNWNWTRSIMN